LKIVISDPKTGKSYQKELDKNAEEQIYQKKIGDVVNGELIDLQGYQFQITGGSDKSGFPMRHDIKGSRKVRVLLSKSVGFKSNVKGIRKRRTVRGYSISSDIEQLNTKITKYGSANLDEVLKKKEKSEGEKK
jgi:small subunit ribosomal protein S6e